MDLGSVPLLCIHFTCEDLARVTIAPAPDPLWEVVLSLRVLGRRAAPARLEAWRVHTLRTLPAPARRLGEVVRSCSRWPDFLTPTRGGLGLTDALPQVVGAPAERVREDLARLEAAGGAGVWPRALAGTGGARLGGLGRTIRAYFEAALAPNWLRVQASVEGERARLSRVLIDGGMERVLTGLWPGINWDPPILRVPHPLEANLHLRGRELVLLPSVFCIQQPLTRLDHGLPPVLVFPVRADGAEVELPPRPDDGPSPDRNLAALIGRTRAAVLQAVTTACTTSELARRVGTSLASASQHASVLRDAGLITSTRYRNAVVHTTTALGTALLARPPRGRGASRGPGRAHP